MPLIVWSEKFEIGIEEVDRQHRILADVINTLREAQGTSNENVIIEDTLYTLKSYSDFHFFTEEDLMTKYRYPLLKDHSLEHKKFTEQMTVFTRSLRPSKKNADPELLEYLKKWFVQHTQGSDRKFVQFFEDAGALEERTIREEKGEPRKMKGLKDGLTPLIVWGDKYLIGIDRIDEQHKKLADAINNLHSSLGEKVNSRKVFEGLKNLFEYTNKHFRFEEEMLSELGYKETSLQKEQHSHFRAEVDSLKDKFRTHGTVVDFNMVVFLKQWFANHVIKLDREYVEYVKKRLAELDGPATQ